MPDRNQSQKRISRRRKRSDGVKGYLIMFGIGLLIALIGGWIFPVAGLYGTFTIVTGLALMVIPLVIGLFAVTGGE